MIYDLAVPSQLLAALLPDLTLMGGAILLLLAAAWRPESDAHQRLIGRGAMGLVVLTMGSVIATALRGATVTDGPIAMDGFRWTMADDGYTTFSLWVISFFTMIGIMMCGMCSAISPLNKTTITHM